MALAQTLKHYSAKPSGRGGGKAAIRLRDKCCAAGVCYRSPIIVVTRHRVAEFGECIEAGSDT